ncbi:MAG TPA: glucose-6-phosphate dehydrogenase assembly protein OpcA [Candidatus Dormibacteraeota bacterium]
MATPALLRTAHASGLAAVERELQALNQARLRQGDEGRGIRLSVLTLVVACTDARAADMAAEVVAEISAEHPARALLVVADPAAPSGIEADLSLQCSVAQGSDQVCAETVRLTAGGEAALHLGSVVAPLLVPDVPVQLWLCGAPDLTQALAPETLAICERIILDSAAYPDPGRVLRRLARIPAGPDGGIPVSDLAWARLAPWRELLARAFDAASRRPFLRGVESVTVRTTGPPVSSDALLLAGWLADRLGAAVEVDPGAAGPAPGLVAAILEARAGESRLRAEVGREPGELVIRIAIDGVAERSPKVADEPPRLAELVGAALQEQGQDAVYAAALRAALALTQ